MTDILYAIDFAPTIFYNSDRRFFSWLLLIFVAPLNPCPGPGLNKCYSSSSFRPTKILTNKMCTAANFSANKTYSLLDIFIIN